MNVTWCPVRQDTGSQGYFGGSQVLTGSSLLPELWKLICDLVILLMFHQNNSNPFVQISLALAGPVFGRGKHFTQCVACKQLVYFLLCRYSCLQHCFIFNSLFTVELGDW